MIKTTPMFRVSDLKELEALFCKEFGCSTFNFEENETDSRGEALQTFIVEARKGSTKEHTKELKAFLADPDGQQFQATALLMCELCNRGLLDEGDYSIEVW